MKTIFSYWLFALGAGLLRRMAAQPTGTFSATGDMQSRRIFHTATLLTDGRVLIAGGSMIEGMGPNSWSRTLLLDIEQHRTRRSRDPVCFLSPAT